jgi:superfamily II DNA or RNA helicase
MTYTEFKGKTHNFATKNYRSSRAVPEWFFDRINNISIKAFGYEPYAFQVKQLWNKLNGKKTKGKFINATGSGKTYIAITGIFYNILYKDSNRVYGMGVHQIAVSIQHVKDTFAAFIRMGITPDISCMHSIEPIQAQLEKVYEEELECALEDENDQRYKNIISVDLNNVDIACGLSLNLQERVNNSKNNNKPHLVFTTYDSLQKVINQEVEFTTFNFDEAHKLVRKDYHNNYPERVNAQYKWFYTGTEKETREANAQGMNNEEKFGTVIGNLSPKEAINEGIIVSPYMIDVFTDLVNRPDKEDVDASVGPILLNIIDKNSKFHGPELESQLLTTLKGSKQIRAVLNDPSFIEGCKERGVKIYAMSSRLGGTIEDPKPGYYVDGRWVANKSLLTSQLKKDSENNTKLVILQIAMADTGLNFRGLNGMVCFRGLDSIAFQQTYGRIARKFKGKKHGVIYLVDFTLEDVNIKSRMKSHLEFILELMNEEEVKSYRESNLYEIEDFDPEPDPEIPPTPGPGGSRGPLGGVIIDEILFGEFTQLSFKEKLKKLDERYFVEEFGI